MEAWLKSICDNQIPLNVSYGKLNLMFLSLIFLIGARVDSGSFKNRIAQSVD